MRTCRTNGSCVLMRDSSSRTFDSTCSPSRSRMTRLGLSISRARKGMAWVSSKVTRVYSRDGHMRTAAMP